MPMNKRLIVNCSNGGRGTEMASSKNAKPLGADRGELAQFN